MRSMKHCLGVLSVASITWAKMSVSEWWVSVSVSVSLCGFGVVVADVAEVRSWVSGVEVALISAR